MLRRKCELMEDIEVGEYVKTINKGIKRIDTIFKNKTINKYGYEIRKRMGWKIIFIY